MKDLRSNPKPKKILEKEKLWEKEGDSFSKKYFEIYKDSVLNNLEEGNEVFGIFSINLEEKL